MKEKLLALLSKAKDGIGVIVSKAPLTIGVAIGYLAHDEIQAVLKLIRTILGAVS